MINTVRRSLYIFVKQNGERRKEVFHDDWSRSLNKSLLSWIKSSISSHDLLSRCVNVQMFLPPYFCLVVGAPDGKQATSANVLTWGIRVVAAWKLLWKISSNFLPFDPARRRNAIFCCAVCARVSDTNFLELLCLNGGETVWISQNRSIPPSIAFRWRHENKTKQRKKNSAADAMLKTGDWWRKQQGCSHGVTTAWNRQPKGKPYIKPCNQHKFFKT